MTEATTKPDNCPTCRHLTNEGREHMAERARENPIYKTDFSKPLWQTIEALRHEITRVRGGLCDIRFAFPLWGDRVDNVEGLLTCGLIAMHGIAREMEKSELKALGDVVRWRSRGIGLDVAPGCFICGAALRHEGSIDYLNNVAAFVGSKEDGEKAVRFIGQGARLDWREHEPTWIQVKVGACDEHITQLEALSNCWYVGADIRDRVQEACNVRD